MADADIALSNTIEEDGIGAFGITILAQDDDVLAVAKPAGLVVHPAYRHPDGTLTDAVFAYADRCGEPRPWLLHRLDRETSGVVLFARTERARRALVRQFQERRIVKRYLAIIAGRLAIANGEVEAPLCRDPADRRRVVVSPTGKPARTRYWTLAAHGDFSLVLAEPLTGRTHQIRAHLASQGSPLAGDAIYGGMSEATSIAGIERAQLHAWELEFHHPGAHTMRAVRAPMPDDMYAAICALGLRDGMTALTAFSQAFRAKSC